MIIIGTYLEQSHSRELTGRTEDVLLIGLVTAKSSNGLGEKIEIFQITLTGGR